MVRLKHRYFVLLVKPKSGRLVDATGSALLSAIRSSIELQQGAPALEAAAPGLAVPFFHNLAGVAIVRVARAQHAKVLQSTLRVSQVAFVGVEVRLLKLTGVLRVAKRWAGEHIEHLMAGQQLTPQQTAAAAALRDKLQGLY